MNRLLGLLSVLLVVTGCSSAPRERDRDGGGAPPHLDELALDRVGRAAGEKLRSAVGRIEERVATDRVERVLPSRDLDVDESRLVMAFVDGARILTSPGAAPTGGSSLDVRVSATVRRAPDGTIAVDYAFSFTFHRGADIPWACVEHASASGARGGLEPQAIAAENLDGLAEQCAKDVARILKAERRVAASLAPTRSLDETPGTIAGFDDRLRAALIREHVRLGTGAALPRIQPEVSFERLDRVTGAETHRFLVEVFEAESELPRNRWERHVTVTGGRTE